jgi:O-methyltransferase
MYQSLLSRHKLITDQMSEERLSEVLRSLESVLNRQIPGDVVEFGCHVGTTSMFLARLLAVLDQPGKRRLYLYDSFEGLPEKSPEDMSNAGTQFIKGELLATQKQLKQNFLKANLPRPEIVKGWFNTLTADQLPETIAFGFVDGDFYHSILDALQLIWPRLSSGGIIAVDDYQREALPGVTKAVQTFYQRKPGKITYAHHIAVLRKP